jgi:membrane protein
VKAYRNWRHNRTIRLGASLAYYGLFALIPLISLCLFLAGLFFSRDDVQSFVADHLGETTEADLGDAAVRLAEELDGGSTLTSLGLIGVIGLLIAASLVFVAVEDALGIIFGLSLGHGAENWFRRRVLAFIVALIIGLSFVVVLAVQAITGLLESLIDAEGTVADEFADLVGVVLSTGFWTVILALMLRVMTRSQVPWRYALLGALLTAIGVSVGGWALGLYFSTIGTGSLAAAAGGVIAVLVFMYYAAQILLAGAELTNVVWLRAPLGADDDQRDGGTATIDARTG